MSNPSSPFVFFWQSGSPFSQWYPAPFEVEGISYNCAEQYMMHQKALLFQDEEMAEKILKTSSPKAQKALGRKTKNFSDPLWNKEKEKIVTQGNYAKFTQNSDLLNLLLQTKGKTLVEASPYDTIWGIGLKAEDPKAQDPSRWRGLNLLGKILTKLRDDLLENGFPKNSED